MRNSAAKTPSRRSHIESVGPCGADREVGETIPPERSGSRYRHGVLDSRARGSAGDENGRGVCPRSAGAGRASQPESRKIPACKKTPRSIPTSPEVSAGGRAVRFKRTSTSTSSAPRCRSWRRFRSFSTPPMASIVQSGSPGPCVHLGVHDPPTVEHSSYSLETKQGDESNRH